MLATLLLLIVLTIAANLHPEGPTMVFAVLLASPFFILGGRALFYKEGVPVSQIGGLVIMLPGFWILSKLC